MIKKAFRTILLNKHLKEVFVGSSIAFALKILGLLGSYVFAFMISRYYGARGMGIYSLSLSILMILEMLGTLGFNTSVLRFVGQFTAENSRGKIKQLYKNILELIIPVSVFLAMALYLLSVKISISIFHDKVLITAFQIVSLAAPLYVVNSVNMQLIRAVKNIKFSEYLRNLNRPLFTIPLLFIIMPFVSNYYIPIIALVIAVYCTFLMSTIYIIKKVKSFSDKADKLLSKGNLLKVSMPMMITAFSFLISTPDMACIVIDVEYFLER